MFGIIASNRLRGGFLPETQAIIDRAITEGFTLPSDSTLSYINTLISVMITDGYWAKRDLILNFAYNDLTCENFSRINWKNPTGNLAEYYRQPIVNILGMSENFPDGVWQKVNSTVDSNVTTNPLGGSTADRYNSTNPATSILRQTLTSNMSSQILYNFSCYAKADTTDIFYLLSASSKFDRGVRFNLTTGIIENEIDGAIGSIQSVGSGWYRCSMQFYGFSSLVAIGIDSNSVFIWGAQLSVGGTLEAYESNVTTGRGRLLYVREGNIGSTFNVEFVNTNFNPTVNGITYTLNNASREAIVYSQISNAYIDGNSSFGEIMRCSTNQPSRINSGSSSGGFDYFTIVNGYKSIHRISSDTTIGIAKDTSSSLVVNSTAMTNGNQTIHRGAFGQGANLISYYSMGAETVTEGQLLRIAYNNYLTNIGLTPIS